MELKEFHTAFQQLTDHPPFPWQEALYGRFISDRADSIPPSCNLPTGLGKTSVVAIWLLALNSRPDKVPRRLVYVVNRRTVVDQTTAEVERLRANLPRLGATLGKLAISTLRGQFADNREWSEDPSRPAVICGTVDMIGSRLLFSGYGVGFKGRPLHAGFLGQDVLLVHDEAHLEPAFQKLIEAVQREQNRCREFGRLHVMELSATSRGDGEVFELTEDDKKNEVVSQRILAKKTIHLAPVDDEKRQLTDKVLELALVHKDSRRPILIFLRSVEAVTTIVAALRQAKQEVQQLTGTLRGRERDQLVQDPIFQRFLPEAKAGDKTVYLACTSAGEVGVNISGDHLLCDLATFDSMAQRFGRVNRFGMCHDTRIDIVQPRKFDEHEFDLRRKKTLELLERLNGNGSPAALAGLNLEDRLAAFSPPPAILPVSDILFDAWSLTTIHEPLPGRPPVADYLHGVSEWEPPQTKVAWRTEVGEITGELLNRYKPEDLLDDYPLKAHELLADRTDRVFNALKKLAAAPETPIWLVDDDNDMVVVTTLGALTEGNKEALDDRTILLPPRAGGLGKGLLDAAAKYDPDRSDYDVADEWRDQNGPLRQRKWDDDARPAGMTRLREIAFPNPDDEDAEPTRIWYRFARPVGGEADARSTTEYGLHLHLDDAKEFAKGIVGRLALGDELRRAVMVAAQCHDLGKDRKRWQNGIGNLRYPAQKWAKSALRRAVVERSPYRHEFGSLLDVTTKQEFTELPEDMRDLVLHLIAGHHGRGRPHFPADEVLDDNYPSRQVVALGVQVPERFARLQRKFGRWGLAYLESLVRAADVLASRKAEGIIP